MSKIGGWRVGGEGVLGMEETACVIISNCGEEWAWYDFKQVKTTRG